MLTLLFIGDIVGKAGRKAVTTLLQELISEFHVDFVVANGENAAGGMGITPKIADQLFANGIDVLTSGNHIWQQKEIVPYFRQATRLIRPANFSPDAPGTGRCVVETPKGPVAVLNVAGRIFMETYSCPFRAMDQQLEQLQSEAQMIVVDFHAEATSEKQALGWYLDGRVGAVIGTHTHVQTADERILPQGTAYLSDAGMTGAMDSVLGVKHELIIRKFLTHMPVRFECARANPQLHGVLVTLDAQRGHALRIERIQRAVSKM